MVLTCVHTLFGPQVLILSGTPLCSNRLMFILIIIILIIILSNHNIKNNNDIILHYIKEALGNIAAKLAEPTPQVQVAATQVQVAATWREEALPGHPWTSGRDSITVDTTTTLAAWKKQQGTSTKAKVNMMAAGETGNASDHPPVHQGSLGKHCCKACWAHPQVQVADFQVQLLFTNGWNNCSK